MKMIPPKYLFKNLAGFILVSCLAAPQIVHASEEYTLAEINEEFPPPFRKDFNPEITRVLVKNNIKGCGILKYRMNKKATAYEALVLCSNDNEHWKAYWVYTLTGEILGPMEPIAGLK